MIALLAATPILINPGRRVRDWFANEPFRWGVALLATQGKPVLPGVPRTALLDGLAAFRRSRGRAEQFDDDARPATLPAAT